MAESMSTYGHNTTEDIYLLDNREPVQKLLQLPIRYFFMSDLRKTVYCLL